MLLDNQFPTPSVKWSCDSDRFSSSLLTQGLSMPYDLKGHQQVPAFVLKLLSHWPSTWPGILPLYINSVPFWDAQTTLMKQMESIGHHECFWIHKYSTRYQPSQPPNNERHTPGTCGGGEVGDRVSLRSQGGGGIAQAEGCGQFPCTARGQPVGGGKGEGTKGIRRTHNRKVESEREFSSSLCWNPPCTFLSLI